MKRIVTLAATFFMLGAFTSFSGIDEIINALKTGNVAQISKYFDTTVEINLPEKSNSYSKNQAEVILRDFFSLHAVKSFEVIHKGENAGSEYCIGTLTTKNGVFRTTVYMKQKGDKQILQEIRFENK